MAVFRDNVQPTNVGPSKKLATTLTTAPPKLVPPAESIAALSKNRQLETSAAASVYIAPP